MSLVNLRLPYDRDQVSMDGLDIAIMIHFHRPSDGDPTVPMRRVANRSMKIIIAIHAVLSDCWNHEKSRPSDEDRDLMRI